MSWMTRSTNCRADVRCLGVIVSRISVEGFIHHLARASTSNTDIGIGTTTPFGVSSTVRTRCSKPSSSVVPADVYERGADVAFDEHVDARELARPARGYLRSRILDDFVEKRLE